MSAPTEVDVVVVGGGPAGLAAAERLGYRGLSTIVVDEYPYVGGRLWGQRYRIGRTRFDGRAAAERLVDAALSSGRVHVLPGTAAVAAERDAAAGDWRVTVAGPPTALRARAVVVATGATELPVVMPGWTLPGVVTVGAAQVLAEVWERLPGRVGLIVGINPLGIAIGRELAERGVQIRGVVLPPDWPANRFMGTVDEQWEAMAAWSRAAPGWLRVAGTLWAKRPVRRRLARWVPARGFRAMGVTLRPAVTALAIEGTDRADAVVLSRVDRDGKPVGRPWREAVDFVAVSGGLSPLPDLLRSAGAATMSVPALGGEVPVLGPGGETTVPGLFAAGNVTGVEGAPIAMAHGVLVGERVRQWLQRVDDPTELRRLGALVEDARRHAPILFHPQVAAGRAAVAAAWHERRPYPE